MSSFISHSTQPEMFPQASALFFSSCNNASDFDVAVLASTNNLYANVLMAGYLLDG